MSSIARPTPPDFITWAFGPTFKARLDAIDAARPPKSDPRESWPDWTDADTWELGPEPEAEPEDTSDHAIPPGPSAREEAFHLGYTLGLGREDAAPPAEFARSQARAFRAGWAVGSREWARRLDEMFAGAVADGRVTDLDAWPRGVC